MKRSIFLMIFLGSFFTVLGQTEYPVTQPTQKVNESPWYGLGLSNSTFPGASGSAVQLAGYYGLLFKTGNGQFSLSQNGNVGIGVVNPNSPLHIKSSTNRIMALDFVIPSGTSYTWQSFLANSIEQWRIIGRNIDNANLEFFNKAGESKFSIMQNGNVGIGTNNPSATLEVKGDFRLGNGDNYNDLVFKTGTTISGNNGVFEISPKTMPGSGTAQQITYFRNASHSNGKTVHNVLVDGNVGIGTTNPDAKLAVNGTIHTKEVKVDLNGWSDFVFYDDYKLPTLEEVERHIKENGHLKDIPNAKEVEKNGILVGVMNAKLLQKIEELTIYTIQQEKRLNQQSSTINKLSKENESLKTVNKTLLEIKKRLKALEKQAKR